MLRSIRVNPCISSASNLPVRRRGPCRPKTEQRLKGSHRLSSTIVPKDELVEVDLELLLADSMVRADQPLLEVADSAIGERHHGERTFEQRARSRLRPPNGA